MNRRGFLGSIFSAGVAPAVVRVASLMPVQVLAPARVWHPYGVESHLLRMVEQQIGDRMALTRELVSYALLRDGAAPALVGIRNSGDTLVYRRFMPYGDVIATAGRPEPRRESPAEHASQ